MADALSDSVSDSMSVASGVVSAPSSDGGEEEEAEEASEPEVSDADDEASVPTPQKKRRTVSVFVKRRAIEEYEAMNPKSKPQICKKYVPPSFFSFMFL